MKANNSKIFSSSISKLLRSLFLCLLCLNTASAQTDSSIQISGQMVLDGDIKAYLISPNGLSVVYLADQDVDGIDELYRVPISGGVAVKLNSALAAGSNVGGDFVISPDSSYVIYRVTQNTSYDELYSVPLSGGNSVNISAGAKSGFKSFEISNDSSRVVYRNTDGSDELYSMPLSGGSAVKITPMPGRGRILNFKIGPDSKNVIYVAEQETINIFELYSAPIGGGSNVKLSQLVEPSIGLSIVREFKFTNDGKHVVYLAPPPGNESKEELYIVATSGGPVTKLNLPLDDYQDVSSNFIISSDDNYVLYNVSDVIANDKYHLYSVPISGGGSVKLSPELVPEGMKLYYYKISPDSKRVVYISNHQNIAIDELYSVPIEGGPIVKLNSPILTPGINNNVFSIFSISPDSARVVYVSRQSGGDLEIFSVLIEGGDPNTLGSSNIYSITSAITSDSSRVIYLKNKLFSVPIEGGYSIVLNDDFPTYGRAYSFLMSSDSSSIVYAADQHVFGDIELFSRTLPTLEEHVPPPEEELCMPIITSGGKVSLICL